MDDSCVVYTQTSEVITLSSSTDADAAGVLGQCLCLDWAPTDGHTRVVGGFARGAIAIWDLITRSPLVVLQSSSGNVSSYPCPCMLVICEFQLNKFRDCLICFVTIFFCCLYSTLSDAVSSLSSFLIL